MKFAKIKIGFALTGSHCTLEETLPEIERLVREGAEVTPIISYSVDEMDTRFGTADYWKEKLLEITGRKPISSIVEAEPIGPQKLLDILVIAPCTGNTLAKMANGITDSPVLMAAKAHLRNCGPVVIAISTNDGLGNNAKNIGALLNSKNMYFVPFGQDNPFDKHNSLVAHMSLLSDTISEALQGRQIQPILVSY
jgi:dipicolinate synthase subunit B